MKRTTISHDLDFTEAKRRIAAEVPRYVREYELSSGWTGSTWEGKRKGVKVTACLHDGQVRVSVDGSWYIPEGPILSRIERELKKVLR